MLDPSSNTGNVCRHISEICKDQTNPTVCSLNRHFELKITTIIPIASLPVMLVSWSIIPLSIVIRCYKMYYRATGWGKTPLHYAARDGLVACVEVLLKAGAKTDIEDHRGSAPQNSFASNSLVKNEETFLIFSSSSFCIWRSEFSWVSLSNCVKKSDVAFSFFVLHQQVILSFVFEFVHLFCDFMRFLLTHALFGVLNICSFWINLY